MKSKNKSQYKYVKLGEQASIFHDTSSDLTITSNQVLRYSTNHKHATNSATLKVATQSGHVVETDEEEWEASPERVTYNGRGVPMDVVTNGKEVPKEPGKEAKKAEAKQNAAFNPDDEDEEEDSEEDGDDEEDGEEQEEDLTDEDETPEAIEAIREKLASNQTLSRKEKKALADYEAKH